MRLPCVKVGKPYSYLDCLNKAGLVYVYNTNYPAASERLFKGIAIAEKYNEKFMLSNLYTNAGLLYESLEDWDNALKFAKKATPLKWEEKDTSGVARCYNNIGNLYYYLDMYDSAIVYLKKANYLNKQVKNEEALFGTIVNIGNCFQGFKIYDSAIYYLKQAEVFSKNIDDNTAIANLFAIMSHTYNNIKNNSLAGKYALMAFNLGKNIEDLAIRKNITEALYKYYKAIGNKSKSFEYLEQFNSIKDTLVLHSKNIEYQKTLIKYESGKKLVADSLQAEQKVLIAKSKTTQTQNSLLIVALLLVAALAIAVILFNRGKLLKRKNLIAEQEKQLEAQQKTAYQLKTLQAQMNPHFVFNCFNTIDSFILQNKQFEASLLVQRFSKLSRKILEQTAVDFISFEEEFETLTTYLQIEKLRSNNSFDFSIEKDATIISHQLPPMLLQPFVENAVVHGVRGLQNNSGLIKITVSNNNNFIEVNIEDNGVGRNKAAEIKQQNTAAHKSMSMDLTLQRLKALHQNAPIENYVQFTDFENGKTGTLVTIKLPKKLIS